MSPAVGVVGAGVAGAGAAYALRESGADVTVLERCGEVGGRTASRERRGCTYELGANYVHDDERTLDLLESLGADHVEVEGPVWTFDREGRIERSDRRERKWTAGGGLAGIVERLFDGGAAAVHLETPVRELLREEGRWAAIDDEGSHWGPYDALVLTPPAPATAAILAETGWQDERTVMLREVVGSVPYRPIRSVVLHYPLELDRPWYALVNEDKDHEVGWLAREERKPDHVPDGESLLLVQMSPSWSREHVETGADEAAAVAADAVAELVGDDRLRDPDWTDERRWRHALPDAGDNREVLRRTEDAGLYFAGDWLVGEGRVHRSLWTGIEAGRRVEERLAD